MNKINIILCLKYSKRIIFIHNTVKRDFKNEDAIIYNRNYKILNNRIETENVISVI